MKSNSDNIRTNDRVFNIFVAFSFAIPVTFFTMHLTILPDIMTYIRGTGNEVAQKSTELLKNSLNSYTNDGITTFVVNDISVCLHNENSLKQHHPFSDSYWPYRPLSDAELDQWANNMLLYCAKQHVLKAGTYSDAKERYALMKMSNLIIDTEVHILSQLNSLNSYNIHGR